MYVPRGRLSDCEDITISGQSNGTNLRGSFNAQDQRHALFLFFFGEQVLFIHLLHLVAILKSL